MTLEKTQQTSHLFQTYLAQAQPHCAQYQFPKVFATMLVNIFALHRRTEVKQQQYFVFYFVTSKHSFCNHSSCFGGNTCCLVAENGKNALVCLNFYVSASDLIG